LSQPVDPFLGTLLGGKYRIESFIARGGMGSVYRGTQEPLGRPVAVKVFLNPGGDVVDDEQMEKRFFREASVSARLQSPNTVVVHDYGALEGRRGVYIVMEFLDGPTLRDVLKREVSIEPARAVRIVTQIGGALVEAHEAQLVHRDLKPGNVLLVRRGADDDFVKVVDFGLVKQVARANDDSAEVLTREGVFLGTPRYMAPEQASGAEVDARTDIYSLGVMLYELLSGEPPFRASGRVDTALEVLTAHLTKPPPPLSSRARARDVPPALERVVMRCLAKSPDDRFPSVRALLEELRACEAVVAAASTTTGALPASQPEQPAEAIEITMTQATRSGAVKAPTGGLVPSPAPPPPTTGDPLAPPAGRWWGMAAAVGAAVVVAVVAGWVVLGPHGGATPPPVEVPSPPPVAAAASTSSTSSTTSTAPPVSGAGTGQPSPSPSFEVSVRSSPPGAVVRRGDQELGRTPLTFSTPREEGASASITVEAPGFVKAVRVLEPPPGPGPREIDVVLEATPVTPPSRPQRPPTQPRRPRPETPPELDIKVDR
jgi:serine/threonine-protein kinase